MTHKWFGPIAGRDIKTRNLPVEPLQSEERKLSVDKEVPSTAIYKAWHIAPRCSRDFYAMDFITDILAGGESGRLYTILVREKKLFSEINAYVTSDIDPGLLILNGKLINGIDIYQAEEEVNKIISNLKENLVGSEEMEKVKNRYESARLFSNTSILNKAANLALYELLGDPELINSEVDRFKEIDQNMIIETSLKYMVDSNCSTLYYKSSKGTR
jgi:zinc protease